jgi:uncharacterized protein YecT (DUF1311 family)
MRVILALCLLPFAASAQEVDCANALVQQEMNFCAEQDWQAADALLNDAYATALAAMQDSDAAYAPEGDSEEERLRTAQRAWVAYRDAACDSAGYAMRGGSAEPLLIYGCMRELTDQRTEGLRSLVEEN